MNYFDPCHDGGSGYFSIAADLSRTLEPKERIALINVEAVECSEQEEGSHPEALKAVYLSKAARQKSGSKPRDDLRKRFARELKIAKVARRKIQAQVFKYIGCQIFWNLLKTADSCVTSQLVENTFKCDSHTAQCAIDFLVEKRVLTRRDGLGDSYQMTPEATLETSVYPWGKARLREELKSLGLTQVKECLAEETFNLPYLGVKHVNDILSLLNFTHNPGVDLFQLFLNLEKQSQKRAREAGVSSAKFTVAFAVLFARTDNRRKTDEWLNYVANSSGPLHYPRLYYIYLDEIACGDLRAKLPNVVGELRSELLRKTGNAPDKKPRRPNKADGERHTYTISVLAKTLS